MIIPSEELLFLGEKRLPSGTILYEKHGNRRWTVALNGDPTNQGPDSDFYLDTLVLPTAQAIEVIIVGGCGSLLCSCVDL